jgi:uncharacterized protein (TIGR02001 family)
MGDHIDSGFLTVSLRKIFMISKSWNSISCLGLDNLENLILICIRLLRTTKQLQTNEKIIMKKVTALVAATVAAASVANAQDMSVSATFEWQSDYIFRGVQLAEETFMPGVDVAYGDFYAGIWAALPVDTKTGADTEVDFYAGYGMAVSDLVSLDVGLTYYVYPSAVDAEAFGLGPNTLEFYAGLAFDMALSPSVYVFYDIEAELFTIETNIGHTFEVSEVAGVDVSGHIGYWDADGGASQMYAGVGAAYVYSFTDSASMSIGVNWYWSEEKLLGSRSDWSNIVTYGFSFTAGF